MPQASFEPGTSRSLILRSAVAPHWFGQVGTGQLKNEANWIDGNRQGLEHIAIKTSYTLTPATQREVVPHRALVIEYSEKTIVITVYIRL